MKALSQKDPKKVRIKADVESVLSELGIRFERNHPDLVIRCPSGAHADRNPSCTVHAVPGEEKNGLIFCFSCKWSADIFDLVERVKNYRFPEAVNLVDRHGIERFVEGEDEDPRCYETLFRHFRPRALALPAGVRSMHLGSECFDYLCSRNFGWRQVEHYNLMDWRCKDRLFVPLLREGRLIGWVARTYRKGRPKALTPPGTPGQRWGFVGFDRLDRDLPAVHLTEGWASCMRVEQAGFQNALAVCGSSLRMEQALELGWAKRLVLWLEGDVAGRGFLNEVLSWLGNDRFIEFVQLPEKKDPADYSPNGLKQLYAQRAVWARPRRSRGNEIKEKVS